MRTVRSAGILGVTASLVLFTWMAPVEGSVLQPVAFGSVRDNPVDGIGDTIFSGAFIANFPVTGNVFSAIVEFDLTAFAGATLAQAKLEGTIFANNFLDTGDRIIELLIYEGNGVLETPDFQKPARSIGTVSYHPPLDQSVPFAFDLRKEVQTLIDNGVTDLGVRFAGLNQPQAPSNLSPDQVTLLVLPVPAPPPLAVCAGGLLALVLYRRHLMKRPWESVRLRRRKETVCPER